MAIPLPAPTVEELCLRTFRACWYLDKDWLVSFVASAQRAKPDSPITWVKFMPKGHTHLVRSALKLVPATKNLPLAKIKEVMFTFVLETLNVPSSSPGFFNTRKATKPRKRVRKRPGKEAQPGDDAMAVTPPPPPAPSLPSVPGPRSPNPSGGGKGDPSSLGEEQGNWSSVQRLSDSSEKPTGILSSSSEEPDTSSLSTSHAPWPPRGLSGTPPGGKHRFSVSNIHSSPVSSPLHCFCAWEACFPPSPHLTSAPSRFPYPPCTTRLARVDGMEMRALLRAQSGPSSSGRSHTTGHPRCSLHC